MMMATVLTLRETILAGFTTSTVIHAAHHQRHHRGAQQSRK